MNYIILDTNCLFRSFDRGINYAEFKLNNTYYELADFIDRHQIVKSEHIATKNR